jgi:hypothetical protein
MKGDGTKSKNGTLSPEAAAKAAIRILGDGTAGPNYNPLLYYY